MTFFDQVIDLLLDTDMLRGCWLRCYWHLWWSIYNRILRIHLFLHLRLNALFNLWINLLFWRLSCTGKQFFVIISERGLSNWHVRIKLHLHLGGLIFEGICPDHLRSLCGGVWDFIINSAHFLNMGTRLLFILLVLIIFLLLFKNLSRLIRCLRNCLCWSWKSFH